MTVCVVVCLAVYLVLYCRVCCNQPFTSFRPAANHVLLPPLHLCHIFTSRLFSYVIPEYFMFHVAQCVCVCMWSNFNQAPLLLLTGVYYPNLDSRQGALVAVVTLSINITMTTGHRKQSCYRRAHVQCSIKGCCCCCMHDRSARDNNCYIVRRARRERNLIGQ